MRKTTWSEEFGEKKKSKIFSGRFDEVKTLGVRSEELGVKVQKSEIFV